ncbi:MAG TPA: 16S rRNA (guanine(966)-N(2))-methyltransferase RsmD [Nitrospiraceae bacterium]|nr:16S rRNA (guanine(966)-N(2))-methyltransferase RsmD [Nitrospiraceae bacterium]
MRVIAGSHKGRRLLSPTTNDIRPTSGRVKEALFSILGSQITGATLLDLFAGTGAIGIEALSRGAASAIFVEAHPASLKLLKTNLDQCGLSENTGVYPGESRAFLQYAARNRLAFDIIFADPPYRDDSTSTLLPLLGQSAMILPHTVVILEHPTKHQIPPQVGRLNRVRQYRYGDTSLSLFRLADEKVSRS